VTFNCVRSHPRLAAAARTSSAGGAGRSATCRYQRARRRGVDAAGRPLPVTTVAGGRRHAWLPRAAGTRRALHDRAAPCALGTAAGAARAAGARGVPERERVARGLRHTHTHTHTHAHTHTPWLEFCYAVTARPNMGRNAQRRADTRTRMKQARAPAHAHIHTSSHTHVLTQARTLACCRSNRVGSTALPGHGVVPGLNQNRGYCLSGQALDELADGVRHCCGGVADLGQRWGGAQLSTAGSGRWSEGQRALWAGGADLRPVRSGLDDDHVRGMPAAMPWSACVLDGACHRILTLLSSRNSPTASTSRSPNNSASNTNSNSNTNTNSNGHSNNKWWC
jgi:hypothetical protein